MVNIFDNVVEAQIAKKNDFPSKRVSAFFMKKGLNWLPRDVWYAVWEYINNLDRIHKICYQPLLFTSQEVDDVVGIGLIHLKST